MYMRFTITISGSHFQPNKVLKKLNTSLILDGLFEENDTDSIIYFRHKNEFSEEYPDDSYEELFVEFFRKNYSILKESGADNFSIFIDIYYSDQCNFEIFNKKYLKELSQFDISLPISVYHIDE